MLLKSANKINLIVAITLSAIVSGNMCFAQSIEEVEVSEIYNGTPLIEVIEQLEEQSSVRFFFIDAWIENIKVSGQFQNITLNEFLEQVFATLELDYMIFDHYTVVILQDKAILKAITIPDAEVIDIEIGDEAKYVLGKQIEFTGSIINEKTGEPLSGASVNIESLGQTLNTDERGSFSTKIPAGKYYIQFNYVGLEQLRKLVALYSDGNLNLAMFEKPIQLEEIAIESRAEDINISSPYLGLVQIKSGVINKLPNLLGEADVVRTLLMMPGVNTVGEGATGINVRGGNIDQNLITLDEAPIFNTSHLFGFFSTINPDATANINFYKGAMPANYGGRASSVIDIGLHEGSADNWHLKGNLGTISSKLFLDGPIGEKTTMAFSGRGSYVNWILPQIQDTDIRNSRASFGDASLKLAHRFNEKAKLTYSGYFSGDSFKFAEDTIYRWSTFNQALKFNYLFNESLVGKITAFDSNYQYEAENVSDINPFTIKYRLNQKTIKADLSIIKDKITIDLGAGADFYGVEPGERQIEETSSLSPITLEKERGTLLFQYANLDYKINDRVSINAGLRFASFTKFGPGTVFTYNNELPISNSGIIDSISYQNGDAIANYSGLEPRMSVKYQLGASTSIKAGLARNYQYLYLVSNTAAATPLDIWRPSDQFVPPLLSDQISIGLFRNFKDNLIETSVEGYYKRLENLVDYKDGADLLLNDRLEQDIIIGDGKAYGVEFMVRKNKGKMTGWMAYTWSRTLRKMDGEFADEILNEGNFFPSNYDIPHNVNLMLNWDLNDWLDIGTNFTYRTGRPVTVPVTKYFLNYFQGQNLIVAEFSNRNEFRIPDYIRLDLSVTYKPRPQRKKKWDSSWTFSVYNLLGRRNPYSVFFQGGDGISVKAYQLSVIGVPIPAITYNFTFP